MPSSSTSPYVLVTGGAGFIGSHTCKALHEKGFVPVTLDNLSAGDASRCQWGPFVEGDINDAAAVTELMAQYKPVGILHFAGNISVPKSVQNPQATYDTNVSGTLNILQAARTHGVKHIIFSSSAAVYGTPQQTPIPEDAPKQPINPYGRSKLMVEHILEDFSHAYGQTFAALRYFNAAGATPDAKLGYKRADPFHLVPMTLLALQGKVPPLRVFGTDYPTPDGTAVRDYVHVADIADAHVLALTHLVQGGDSLALNLGTSRGVSVRDILRAVETVTGQKVPHTEAPRREGDPAILVADATRAKDILNWTPTRSDLQTIIASDWAWHQSLV
jgi:UDP-glucose-4-epimerase GalE